MVLIVTNSSDATADFFIKGLENRNQPFFRFDTDKLIESYTFHYVRSQSASVLHIEDHQTSRRISSSTVTGVWYRRPVFPIVEIDDADQDFNKELAQELRCQYESFLRESVNAVWVSLPERLRFAEDRLIQLRTAAAVGFSIPDTIITNSCVEARHFCQSHYKTCTKPLYLGQVVLHDDLFLFHTSLIQRDDSEFVKKIANFPVLLQEYIDKQTELRLTVVHNRVFPVEIISRPGTEAAIDWRIDNGTQVEYRSTSISPELTNLSIKIVQQFGLEFAAMDVVISRDGRYYFLDLNPNGQWAWLDQLLGLGIADELRTILSGGK